MPNPEPSVFDETDPQGDERALQRGQADYATGKVISNDAMKRWLLSWGAGESLPRPKCGA
jgi:predicted transcriptional regulator